MAGVGVYESIPLGSGEVGLQMNTPKRLETEYGVAVVEDFGSGVVNKAKAQQRRR